MHSQPVNTGHYRESSRKKKVIVRPNVPEDGHIRPKHVVKEKTYGIYICTMNCVDGNNNKTSVYYST
jgi:hypothetical protein